MVKDLKRKAKDFYRRGGFWRLVVEREGGRILGCIKVCGISL